jgi:hypothetical protein
MSRYEKINKLANAIRRWRGMVNASTGKWHRPPAEKELDKVQNWLVKLNLPVQETLQELCDMTTYDQFEDWLKKINNLS